MIPRVQLEDVFKTIGFAEVSDKWYYDFGNFKIIAYRYFDPFDVYHFYGNLMTRRSAQEFEFKLPATIDSYEQGVALIAYYFRNVTFDDKPEWIDQGLKWEEHLPWEKKRLYKEKRKKSVENIRLTWITNGLKHW